MKTLIKAVKKTLNKALTKELTYKERLDLFSKEYKKLAIKYRIDFTMMPIDLDTVYQEGGVNKVRKPEETK